MNIGKSKFASALALGAVLSLTATPAAAVDLPAVGSGQVKVETGAWAEQNQHHRYRRDRYGYRYRNRVDAGDVITGVLVLGTIAAIAGVFDGDDDRRDRRDRDYRDRDYRNGDYRDRDYDDRRDRYESEGVERAADMCVDQIERGEDRVDDVTDATRRGDGWHVSGTLENGGNWTCWIDNQGRIREVDFGASEFAGDYGVSPVAGDQWSDEAYRRARANTRTPAQGEYTYRSAEAPVADEPQPDYPGGPLPDDDYYGEDVDADLE